MLVHASTLVCSLVVSRCEGLELEPAPVCLYCGGLAVHASNTSLSAHTFCCSPCCSGLDCQELQVLSTLSTVHACSLCENSRPHGGIEASSAQFFSARQVALRGVTTARGDVWLHLPLLVFAASLAMLLKAVLIYHFAHLCASSVFLFSSGQLLKLAQFHSAQCLLLLHCTSIHLGKL